MTVPMRYAHASEEFEKLLRLAQERLDRATRHQTYQSVHGVLVVFRRRLTVRQALDFGAVLPAVAQAMLVSDWDTDAPVLPFGTRAEMTREIQAVRVNHNLSPDTVIGDVAGAMRAVVDPVAFERCLAELGPDAQAFWAAD